MITHKTTWLLAGLLWLALWPGAARGQSPELQEAYDSFEALYAKDYYEEALPFAKKALRLGRSMWRPIQNALSAKRASRSVTGWGVLYANAVGLSLQKQRRARRKIRG